MADQNVWLLGHEGGRAHDHVVPVVRGERALPVELLAARRIPEYLVPASEFSPSRNLIHCRKDAKGGRTEGNYRVVFNLDFCLCFRLAEVQTNFFMI